MAESFGGCLGMRVAAAAPELVERLVLVNPATSFARALGGLPGAIAGTNLLSLFPEPLYQVQQSNSSSQGHTCIIDSTYCCHSFPCPWHFIKLSWSRCTLRLPAKKGHMRDTFAFTSRYVRHCEAAGNTLLMKAKCLLAAPA